MQNKNQSVYGAKLWINVFWTADGQISHIAYYPQPESINFDFEIIKKGLTEFLNTKYPILPYETPYAHYGSFHFPVFVISIKEKE